MKRSFFNNIIILIIFLNQSFVFSKILSVTHVDQENSPDNNNNLLLEQLVDGDGSGGGSGNGDVGDMLGGTSGPTSMYQLLNHLNSLHPDELGESCRQMKNSFLSPFKCVNYTLKQETDQQPRMGQNIKSRMVKSGMLKNNANPLKPIILVPGIAGSGLEARLNKTTSPAFYCSKKSNWYRIWLAVQELFVQKCWFDNLATNYNVSSGESYNTPGVEIRPIDFGGIRGVGYLDYKFGFKVGLTNVYGEMISFFKDLGYTPGLNIRGAPFDWRVSIKSIEKDGWFNDLKKLIEDTYESNQKQKVVLIAHSMGGITSLYFLDKMTVEWKLKYIDTFIPIAAPWSGAPKAIRTLISGDNLGIGLIKYNYLKEFSRESGGVIQLIPDSLLWGNDKVFVSTPQGNFTLGQTHSLLGQLGLNVSSTIYNSLSSIISGKVPGVKTSCLYGIGVKTEIKYEYQNGFDSQPFIHEEETGDGTVPLDSLNVCKKWTNLPNHPSVEIKEFPLAQHLDIISDPTIFQHLARIIISQ